MRRILLILLCVLLSTSIGEARRRGLRGGATVLPPVSSCPFPTGASDGCSSANATITGAHQQPNFFGTVSSPGYAAQNGQTWQTCSATGTISGTTLTTSGETLNTPHMLNCIIPTNNITGPGIGAGCSVASGTSSPYTLNQACGNVTNVAIKAFARPNWNVPGVDYPVGAAASGVLPVNPNVPLCNTSTSFEGLCLSATSYGQAFPNNVIVCQTGSTCNLVTGIDFTGYTIDAKTSQWSGNCFFQNDRFVNTTAIDGIAGLSLVEFEGTSTCNSPIWFDHTDMNLAGSVLQSGSSATNGFTQDAITSHTNLKFTYDWFSDQQGRMVNAQYGLTLNFNYMEGFDYGSAAHGEFNATGICFPAGNCPTSIPDLIDYRYNTMLARSIDCGGNTTFLWISAGGTGPIYTGGANIENDVGIDNACGAFSVTNVAGSILTISVPTGVGYLSGGTTISGCGVSSCGGGLQLTQPWGTLQGTLTSQPTGTNGLSGTYGYSGSSAANGTLLTWNTGCVGAGFGGTGPDIQGTVNILNNFGDQSGNFGAVFETSDATHGAGACNGGVTGSVVSSGNVNMNLNANTTN